MRYYVKFTVAVLYIFFLSNLVSAQNGLRRVSPVSAQCGNIIDGEFTSNYEEQIYRIQMNAGEMLDLSLAPLGGQLSTVIFLTGPTNLGVAISNGFGDTFFGTNQLVKEPKLNTEKLSAGGNYTIRVTNFTFAYYHFNRDQYQALYNSGGIGNYTLFVGCTLSDGTAINPGDSVVPPTPISPTAIPTISPEGSEFMGFPGLPSVDFSSAFVLHYTTGTPFPGQIPATGPGVIGFTLNAAANDILDLKFDRTSGNLNLGVVVLFGQDQILFYGGLIASNTLSTTLTLPSDGQYTIGVFRVDLVPPAAPEATAFQVLGMLNP